MGVVTSLEQLGLSKTFDYIYKDPDKNMVKIMDWVDRFAGDNFVGQRKAIRAAIEDSSHHIIRLSAM